MNQTAQKLAIALVLPALATPLIAQDAPSETPRFKITNASITPHVPEDPFADNARDGRVIFAGQPTEKDLRAFAANGGKVVICSRSESEMDRLKFNEAALC